MLNPLQQWMDTLQVQALPTAKRWVLGLSGGVDSVVCLYLLQQIAPCPILAVHVHHGLSPNADAWAAFCEQFCASLQIPCVVEKVTVACGPRQSLEAVARSARYQALDKYLGAGHLLITAQHQDDQVETFLLQLMRGAGLDGLSSMPALRTYADTQHWRPLLSFTRAHIEEFACMHQLSWVEDESNNNSLFRRNFLRHQIVPRLQQYWPKLSQNVARSCEHLWEARHLLDEMAQELSSKLIQQSYGESGLALEPLAQLSCAKQKLVVRYWLQGQGVTLSTVQLQQLLLQMLDAAPDKSPCLLLSGKVFRRFEQVMYCTEPSCAADKNAVFYWDKNTRWLKLSEQACVHIRLCSQSMRVRLPLEDEIVTLRYRQGGERIHLLGRTHSHRLKQLIQAIKAPPWHKEQWPLIYYNQSLVAVADQIIDANYICTEGQPGLVFGFQLTHSNIQNEGDVA